jgi:hypothetical protein
MKTIALNLNELERQIIKAMRSAMVKDVDDKRLISLLIVIIENAFADTGQSPKVADGDHKKFNNEFAKSLKNDIREYFSSIRIDEISLAVKNGIRNYYGEFYGINVSSIHGFIRSYKHSAERSEAIRKQKLHEDSTTESEEQKPVDVEPIFRSGCIQAFEDYKKTKNVIDFGSVRYEYLKSKGLILISEEQHKVLKIRAKTLVELELSSMKSGKDTSSIIALINMFNNQRENRIEAEINLLAIKDYFDTLIANNQNLADLIK